MASHNPPSDVLRAAVVKHFASHLEGFSPTDACQSSAYVTRKRRKLRKDFAAHVKQVPSAELVSIALDLHDARSNHVWIGPESSDMK